MIVREALRSLKNSSDKALFFALTFFLTSALLFTYFPLAEAVMAGKSETFINAYHLADLTQTLMKGNAGNLMMVFVVIMCAADILFANAFFVKNKAKELGVRLICGATYLQMAFYLLVQTVLIMLAGISAGMLCGYGLLEALNGFLHQSGEAIVVHMTPYAGMEFIVVMLFIVFWTVLLNCSFAYKSGAALLAGGDTNALLKAEKKYGIQNTKAVQILLNGLGILLAVLPFWNYFRAPGGLVFNMLISCVGLDRVLMHILIPALSAWNRKRGTKNTVHLSANGFLRRDLFFARIPVYMFLLDLVVLMSMLFLRENTRLEYYLVLISFCCISVLQAMTIMFRIETDLSGREKEWQIMIELGIMQERLRQVQRREIFLFYGFVFVLALLYIGIALIALFIGKMLDRQSVMILGAASFIPLLLAKLLTDLYYRSLIQS